MKKLQKLTLGQYRQMQSCACHSGQLTGGSLELTRHPTGSFVLRTSLSGNVPGRVSDIRVD